MVPSLTCVRKSSNGPLAHAASFIIELHNGHDIRTSRIWEDGDELKSAAAAGTPEVPRAQVKRITTSTRVANDMLSSPLRSPSTSNPAGSATNTPAAAPRDSAMPQTGGTRQASPAKTPDRAKGLDADEAQSYHAKKVMLMGQLDDATKTYLEASEAREPDAKKAALDRDAGLLQEAYRTRR